MGGQTHRLTQEELADELAMLWTVGQFFASLHKIMLEKEQLQGFSLSELQAKMEELQSADKAENSLLTDVHQLLQRARASLAMLDARINVSVVRRFFERAGEPEEDSLRQIVMYYLSKPAKDENDRDKIDLLITRLCSLPVPDDKLRLREPIAHLDQRIEEVCAKMPPIELESIQSATISGLRQLGRIIREARSFNTLIEGKLISQLRQYKINLGDVFYVPLVLSEVVKVNVAVHNKFQELYFSEQARLRMETARLMRSVQETGKYISAQIPQHPMLGQLNGLTLQLQQFIQDLKRNLTDQILEDRAARASIEADGSAITLLIGSLEESLKRSRELLGKLQEVYARANDKEARP